jgi:HEAT repeat protein
VFPEIWAVLDQLIEAEVDAEVTWWVVSCLGFQHGEQALDRLIRFATNPDPEIRASVAFYIAFCGNPNDQRIIETQLLLARDAVAEVRGHATYDFMELTTADTPVIRQALIGLLEDPDETVRSNVREAIDARDRAADS